MLKKIWRLFLGLVVFAGSACVTPTYASSADAVILTHIQPASPASAKDEMVALYNNSPNEVDITNWCITNKSGVALACFTPNSPAFAYYLPAYSGATIATASFLSLFEMSTDRVTQVFVGSNQSSGGIVNSNDIITLLDANGQVRDVFSWSTAMPAAKVAMRARSATDPRVYEVLDVGSAWAYEPLLEVPASQAELRAVVDADPEVPEATQPEPNVVRTHPVITELLPDVEGSDTGSEFIELYNPSDASISLDAYRLRIGKNLEKVYTFPPAAEVPPQGSIAFTNSQVHFSLNNTASQVQLEYQGVPVGEVVEYEKPSVDWSWALVGEGWQYTNIITPNAPNQAATAVPSPETSSLKKVKSVLKPCAVNQYRSPETNRCRLIASKGASTPRPCKVGQVRNPETHRCRLAAPSSKVPAPCKVGQERNPETNRCRTVAKMTKVGYAVQGVTTQQQPTNLYIWLGIAGVASLIVAYGIWEWRDELQAFASAVRQKFARSK